MEKSSEKIKTLHQLSVISQRLKKAGKKIVHCHGVFDLVHPGHIRYFSSAKNHGDILVVTLTADRFVKKGPGRPIFSDKLRAEVLAAIEIIDYVAIVHHEGAVEAIGALTPDFYVKGPDYKWRKPNPNIPRKLGLEEAAVSSHGGKFVFTDDILFSSSHLINNFFSDYPPRTKAFLDAFRQKYSGEKIIDTLSSLRNKKILVIGDAIIDQYHYSRPLGKSSKEPIVVHKYEAEESFAGGALATANHIAAVSDRVTIVTVLGKKNSYESFIRKNIRSAVIPNFFYRTDASTIVKRRFIDSDTKQKLFQISYIEDTIISPKTEKSIHSFLNREIPTYDVVVVNDFGHGLITPKIIKTITSKAKFLAINVQANSANWGFNVVTKYPRADYVCIDDHEIRLATHDKYSQLPVLMRKVVNKLHCQYMIITKGPHGSIVFSKGNGHVEVPALTDKIVDRVGAGDALFSITAPLFITSLDPEAVAFVGNVAAALKLQTIGHRSPLDFSEMTKFITRLLK